MTLIGRAVVLIIDHVKKNTVVALQNHSITNQTPANQPPANQPPANQPPTTDVINPPVVPNIGSCLVCLGELVAGNVYGYNCGHYSQCEKTLKTPHI